MAEALWLAAIIMVGGSLFITAFTKILFHHVVEQPPDRLRRSCQNCGKTIAPSVNGWWHIATDAGFCSGAIAKPGPEL